MLLRVCVCLGSPYRLTIFMNVPYWFWVKGFGERFVVNFLFETISKLCPQREFTHCFGFSLSHQNTTQSYTGMAALFKTWDKEKCLCYLEMWLTRCPQHFLNAACYPLSICFATLSAYSSDSLGCTRKSQRNESVCLWIHGTVQCTTRLHRKQHWPLENEGSLLFLCCSC